MNQNKVAVITRTKNRPVFLKRAIESVLSQDYDNWQMIIVNDAGYPDVVDLLVKEYEERFKDRVKVIHKEKSSGMESASNTGIKSSNSEYVVIHDDDDSWQPDFLKECIGFLDSNKRWKGVISHSVKVIERVEDDKIIIEKQEPFNFDLKTISFFKLAAHNLFSPISFVYRREVYDTIGYYDEELPVLGDWEFNLRFIKEYDIFVIRKALANYHHRLFVKNKAFSNSIIGDLDKHILYDTIIRNKLLREDIKTNRIGIGVVCNIARDHEILLAKPFPVRTLPLPIYCRIINRLFIRKKRK